MTSRFRPARVAAAGLAAGLLLTGCELALHEVQQATADGCDPWRDGCPALTVYTAHEPAAAARMDLERAEIVGEALEAPYRPCNGIGLACQGRIIGDVLWDQYVMVLAGRSRAASTAASARRAVPAEAAAMPAPAAAPEQAQPMPAPGRIVRTHGTRAGEAATTAPPR